MALTLALLVALIVLVGLSLSATAIYNENQLGSGDYYRYTLQDSNENDRAEGRFEVLNGSQCDMYIMSQEEYGKYRDGERFKPSFTAESTNQTDFNWTQPDGQLYHILVDNWDNGNVGDTKPDGNVTYSILYFLKEGEKVEDDFELNWTTLAICAGVVLVVLVIFVALVVKFDKPNLVDPRHNYPGTGYQPASRPGMGHPPSYDRPPPELSSGTYDATVGREPGLPQMPRTPKPPTAPVPAAPRVPRPPGPPTRSSYGSMPDTEPVIHTCQRCFERFAADRLGRSQTMACPYCGEVADIYA